MDESKARESAARRRAAKLGLMLRKSRVRTPNIDNQGGYMLIEPYGNYVVSGERFDLQLEHVEAELDEREKRMT